jgi:hypothetical protein
MNKPPPSLLIVERWPQPFSFSVLKKKQKWQISCDIISGRQSSFRITCLVVCCFCFFYHRGKKKENNFFSFFKLKQEAKTNNNNIGRRRATPLLFRKTATRQPKSGSI